MFCFVFVFVLLDAVMSTDCDCYPIALILISGENFLMKRLLSISISFTFNCERMKGGKNAQNGIKTVLCVQGPAHGVNI